MGKIKILIFIVFSGLFLSACDSSGTQEENSTIDLSSKPDGPKDPEDPNFQVSVVTPVTTITTISLEGEGFASLFRNRGFCNSG